MFHNITFAYVFYKVRGWKSIPRGKVLKSLDKVGGKCYIKYGHLKIHIVSVDKLIRAFFVKLKFTDIEKA